MSLEFRICPACHSRHAVQRNGLMSIHSNPAGNRCTGMVYRTILTDLAEAALAKGGELRAERIAWRVRENKKRVDRAVAALKRQQQKAERAPKVKTLAAPSPAPTSVHLPTQITDSAVMINCPICGTQVRVLRDGHVRLHGTPNCPFRRTAHNHARPTLQPLSTNKHGGTLEQTLSQATAAQTKLRVAREAQRIRQASASRQSKDEKQRRRLVHVANTVRCPKCGHRASRLSAEPGVIGEHKSTERSWCSNGAKPTALQRAAEREQRAAMLRNRKPSKSRRSVWAFSGGLPSLGRGH